LIGVGLVGYGYWGPNLARNFSSQPACRLVAICEENAERAAVASRYYPQAEVTQDYQRLLGNPDISAILIATKVGTHYELTKQALLAGKDVLVEKPLTPTSGEAAELVELARDKGRVLCVDHTFLFTGAVRKIKEIVDADELGRLLYFDSVRVNLGLFQPDVNVIYDLAPHDISILCHLVDRDPVWVQAMGASHSSVKMEHHAYLHMSYEGGLMAHLHLSWLAPVKIRRTIIAGERKMIVYDDLAGGEKVKIYDKGVDIKSGDTDSLYDIQVNYRSGDMVAPKLDQTEALRLEAEHFLACLRGEEAPLADGQDGLRVVRILEASRLSLEQEGRRVALDELA